MNACQTPSPSTTAHLVLLITYRGNRGPSIGIRLIKSDSVCCLNTEFFEQVHTCITFYSISVSGQSGKTQLAVCFAEAKVPAKTARAEVGWLMQPDSVPQHTTRRRGEYEFYPFAELRRSVYYTLCPLPPFIQTNNHQLIIIHGFALMKKPPQQIT